MKTPKREMPKRRSWIQQSAYRPGAGPHRDSRTARKGTRAQARNAAIGDQS